MDNIDPRIVALLCSLGHLMQLSLLTFVEGSGSIAVDCSIVGIVESVVTAVDGGANSGIQVTTPTKSTAAGATSQSPQPYWTVATPSSITEKRYM